MKVVTVSSVLFVLLAAACTKSSGQKTGSERGPCYGNGTCDEGLICLSELCVKPTAEKEQHEETIVEKIGGLADEACECRDMGCAENVQAKLMDLVKDAKEPSRPEEDKIMRHMERMGECMAKLAIPGATRPPAPDPKRQAHTGAVQLAVNYARWSMDHEQACPDSIQDLVGYGRNHDDAKDPWGNEYVMFCGKDAPADAEGFGIASKGPDGKLGTADDLVSWRAFAR